MKITQTRVALAVVVAALIIAAVWRMAPPAASTAPAEPARVAQPTPPAAVEAPPVTLASVPRTISASTGSGVGTATLLKRAQAGDARAQFRLSERIRMCRPVLRLAERGELSAMTEAEACRRDGIPVDGDQAWRDKALAAGDPIALLYAALESKDPAQFEAAAEIAARSGDPEAYITLGHHLLAQDGTESVDAIAWMILGCPDCMVDDPRLGFAGCVEFDTCQPGTTFVDWLASSEEGSLALVQEAQARAESLKALYGVPKE